MRGMLLLLGVVAIFSSCKKSNSESEKLDVYAPYTEPWINKKQKGIDFFAVGTEPFWNLEVGAKNQIKFYEFGSADTISMQSPVLYRNNKADTWSYTGKSSSGALEVIIREGECSDNMSDNKYYYNVEVNARGIDEREDRKFIGCGSFLNDYRLNDVFALTYINGVQIKPQDSINGSPFIEMNLPTKKIMGKAGCNSFQGSMMAGLNGAEIEFGPLASTRMACPQQSIENEFLNLLSGKRVQYSFTNEGLVFNSGGNTLKFKKAN